MELMLAYFGHITSAENFLSLAVALGLPRVGLIALGLKSPIAPLPPPFAAASVVSLLWFPVYLPHVYFALRFGFSEAW